MVLFGESGGRRLDQCPRLFCPLHLGEVDDQVVGEPPVAGPEYLRFGGLIILHDSEAVVVGFEVHDLIVAHPELLLGPEK